MTTQFLRIHFRERRLDSIRVWIPTVLVRQHSTYDSLLVPFLNMLLLTKRAQTLTTLLYSIEVPSKNGFCVGFIQSFKYSNCSRESDGCWLVVAYI